MAINHKLRKLLLWVVYLLCLVQVADIYPAEVSSLIPRSVSHEVDLIETVLGSSNFAERICRSLKLDKKGPEQVSFLHVSFTFFYPNPQDVEPSHAEMIRPDDILFKMGRVARVGRSSDIPLDYVRVFDPKRKRPEAELNVLLLVTSPILKRERVIQRKAFRFYYSGSDKTGCWAAVDSNPS